MRTVAIIQARTGSTRLPGKVLKDLAGEPMLARVFGRVCRAQTLDAVWVATTTEPSDDVIAALCEERGWPYIRGSEMDTLDRYRVAARAAEADVIVRITSDCPLVDPGVVDQVVDALAEDVMYSSNVIPKRTFPRGLDAEAFRVSALGEAWLEAETPSDREHVTAFLWRQPERFSQANVVNADDYSFHRWTVDTEDDYALVGRIYQHIGHDDFDWTEVLELLGKHPSWIQMNDHVKQKKIL